MKKLAAIVAMAITFSVSAEAQTTLAHWTFENTGVAGVSNTTTFTYGPADAGTLSLGSSASGSHASAGTDWSFPAGNGSARALSSNNWSVNDYYQFTLSTAGYEALSVSFGQLGSATGPANFSFQYSTDGNTFQAFGSPITLTSTSTWNVSNFDLSSVPSLNDAANVYFRIINTSTNSIGGVDPVAATGTSRIDDFLVTGTVIPEPSTYAMMGLGAMLLVGFQRFRRKS